MTARDIVMKRRREVMILHNAKYTAKEIGQQLGWPAKTIEADIAWWHRQNEWQLKIGNPVMDILMNYSQEYRDYLQLQKSTKDESVKRACIAGRQQITKDIKQLLQETNNMYTKPVEVDMRVMSLTPERVQQILEAKKRRQIEDELIESS